MTEILRSLPIQPQSEGTILEDSGEVFSAIQDSPIQLTWEPEGEKAIGTYTQLVSLGCGWDVVNRRSSVRENCRNIAWRLLNPRVFTR